MAPQQPSFTRQQFNTVEHARRRRFWWHVAGAYTLALLLGALAFLLYPLGARAEPRDNDFGARFELLAGTCKQNKIANGIWFQEAYPHNLDFTSACTQLGVSFLTATRGPWSFGWRFAYVDLGTMHFDSIFAMRDDEQHLLPDGSQCNPANLSGCLGRGRGEQRAQGVSAGYIVERNIGPVVLGGDVGLFLYDGRFRVSIDGYGSGPATFGHVDFDWRGYQLTPYAGATARYGDLVLMARVYGRVRAAEHGCGGCSGFANGHATQISAGISIPF